MDYAGLPIVNHTTWCFCWFKRELLLAYSWPTTSTFSYWWKKILIWNYLLVYANSRNRFWKTISFLPTGLIYIGALNTTPDSSRTQYHHPKNVKRRIYQEWYFTQHQQLSKIKLVPAAGGFASKRANRKTCSAGYAGYACKGSQSTNALVDYFMTWPIIRLTNLGQMLKVNV